MVNATTEATVHQSTRFRCAFHQSAARAARLGFDEVTVISGSDSFSGGGRVGRDGRARARRPPR